MSEVNPFTKGVRYLRSEDVLKRFGISRFTLRRWHSDGVTEFPKPLIVGRRHYFSEPEILRWEMRKAGIDPDAIVSIAGLKVSSKLITDYDQFVDAMVNRRHRMKISAMELDAVSGMQEGYTAKLENYRRAYGRGVGPDTMPLWLGGLKLGIILVELPKATRNFRARAKPAIGEEIIDVEEGDTVRD